MPKLPRGAGKASPKPRAKKPATKAAATSKRARAKKESGSTAATTAAKSGTSAAATAPKKKPTVTRSTAPRANGGRATKAKPKAAERDFRHRPVDRAEQHAPAGPKARLTDNQRVLLGDLFAVV